MGSASTPVSCGLLASAYVPGALRRILERPLPGGAEGHLAELGRRLEAGTAYYISTPITTGPRLLAWRRAAHGSADSDPFGQELKREVIEENVRALAPLRMRVSGIAGGLGVIDPTELDQPGWTQADYHRFWIEVIGRFARTLVLADGWQYSTGCAYEFSAALMLHIPVLDSNLDPVDIGGAIASLDRARVDLAEAGLASDGARAALDTIEHLALRP